MPVVDAAVQWLFWLQLSPLAFVSSWVPQWRGDWRQWYRRQVEWPFMDTPLFFSGLLTTPLYGCSLTGVYMLWRNELSGLSSSNQTLYTCVMALYLAASVVYGMWQIPYYYYALPYQSLALLAVSAALFWGGTVCSWLLNGHGVAQYPAAAVLQTVWCAWLTLIVGSNALIALYRLNHTYGSGGPRLHLQLRSAIREVLENDGANPPERGQLIL